MQRRIETTDFPILNLSELTAKYRKYRIRGLNRESSLYYPNLKTIVRKLSYSLKKPVTTIEEVGVPYLIVRSDVALMPTSVKVIKGATVMLDKIGDEFTLDYTERSPQNDAICSKFLHFAIQDGLYDHPELWQPKAGAAFFKREPISVENGIAHFIGFSFRVVRRGAGLAIRAHIANKYISDEPIPAIISSADFENWRGRSVIYRFGYRWYEAKCENRSDLSVVEYTVPDGDTQISLIEFVAKYSKKPVPPELSKIPMDGSVIGYRTNRNEDRAMPAGLCYPVFSAHNEGMGELHKKSLLPPHKRRYMSSGFVRKYLSRLRFGTNLLKVDSEPIETERKMFKMPDLLFGNSTVLSVRNTRGAINVSLENYGRKRLELLSDRRAGFYETEPLGRQYLILPQSVMDSYGETFKEDIADTMEKFYPQEERFQPEIITYNDRVKRTFCHQGNAIREALESNNLMPGHAVVMIHQVRKSNLRDEDELAAMTIQELDRYQIRGAVIHTSTTQKSYVLIRGNNGNPQYVQHRGRRQHGILKGYLQNVVLNKILLNNERWAFVLATRLNADLVIGIDVKNNTAGITVIGSNGIKIQSFCRPSKQKEQLTSEQIEKWLGEIINAEISSRAAKNLEPLRHIVIHRDGKVWETETIGAEKLIKQLKTVGGLIAEASLTIVEIPKNLLTPLRFFDVEENRNGGTYTENPQIGLYEVLDENEGFVCTTGRAFPRAGTVEPLCAKRICGELSMEQCLEDIFYLSALTLTKPDDCSRYPISIKLNDRALTDAATEYDEDELEYVSSDDNEEEEGNESDGDFVRDIRRSA